MTESSETTCRDLKEVAQEMVELQTVVDADAAAVETQTVRVRLTGDSFDSKPTEQATS